MKKIVIALVVLLIVGSLGANAYFASNWRALRDPQPGVVDQGFLAPLPESEAIPESAVKIADEEAGLASQIKEAREHLPELEGLEGREAREFLLEWKKPELGFLFLSPAEFKRMEFWWLLRGKDPSAVSFERFRSGDKTIYIYTYENSKKVLVVTDKTATSCISEADKCRHYFSQSGVL